jgi:(3R)-3-hydroxyacyl-CoA dehydrogenase / 3a,7a,12a-trihydroxy-5b-cholest-24-enoyl-CoA hydratase / enoyl-CoA hydratase 2
MSTELRFDGKVAIVTGAGGGLGRSHALLLAARGAKVVVNDLGGSHTGEGKSQRAADSVVAEIKQAGGEAIANYDSVEDGDKIVKTAVDAFGRVDILVNNAGILRDTSFHKMTQDDWDLIYRVHVLGSFRVTHAVWPLMREQNYGRIVMTASAAGIYGNFGQANYAMAKLGLLGLANTLAIEGRKRNIVVNTIAPIAGSRLTETVLPKELLDALKPEYVSPLVAWLCHESCEDTGGLYECGGGLFARLRWERSLGKVFRLGRPIAVEDVADSWQAIAGFEKTSHPDSVAVSMQPVMQNVEAGPSKGGNAWIDVDQALGYTFPEVRSTYNERDLALYALGVGAATDPADQKDLQLVYEMHGGGMKALPTYGVIPALTTIMRLGQEGKQAPGLKYGFDRVLHGEQYMELKRPLPRKAELSHRARVKDIFDKGKHALVVTEVKTYDDGGNELVRNEVTTLVRGAGGWGGDRGPSADINTPPDRAPDAVVEEAIPANQALLYRLSGDWNPLHADPSFAKAVGYDRPILHGLCTFGFAARHVIHKTAPGADPDFFKSVRVRFADTVFPGETLITEMWKESDQRVVFRCKVKERDSVVISNAAVEYFAEIPKPAARTVQQAAAPVEAAPISADLFRAVAAFVDKNPEAGKKAQTVFQFRLTDPPSLWTLDLKAGRVADSEIAAPDCTLTLSDADFMAMSTGNADPMKLFTTGKLKISGDMMAAQKLSFLKNITPDLVSAAMHERLAAGGRAGGAGTADAEPSSGEVFIAIGDHVEHNPDLANKVGTVFLFKLRNPDSAWTVDLKAAPGSVFAEETAAPDCTLELADADFLAMTSGKADPMKLFTTGKLKISGDMMAAQKLSFLQKIDPERARAAVVRSRTSGAGASAGAKPAAGNGAGKKPLEAEAIFAALGKRLADNPGLAGEVGGVVQFQIPDAQGKWVLDCRSNPPTVTAVSTDKADATLTLNDADLAVLVAGQASAQSLYQRGKLRVDGDVRMAHRLGILKGLS